MFFLINACSSTTFYQLYKTESSDTQKEAKSMIHENEDVKIIYNFWDEYGNSSFLLFNKTESDIYVDLKKSHLIINGIANTYFQNSTFAESSSSSYSIGSSSMTNYYKNMSIALINNSSFYGHSSSNIIETAASSLSSYLAKSKSTVAKGQSVIKTEQDVICVPSKAAKVFSGFSLNVNLFRDCDLLRFPPKNKIPSKNFNTNSTPFTLKNIISYGFEETRPESNVSIETKFWISEISNYPESAFTETRYSKFCEEKSNTKQSYFLFNGPDRFYISYKKRANEEFKF